MNAFNPGTQFRNGSVPNRSGIQGISNMVHERNESGTFSLNSEEYLFIFHNLRKDYQTDHKSAAWISSNNSTFQNSVSTQSE